MEKLEWDTNFFKKNVYRISSSSYHQIQNLVKRVVSPSIIYISSDLEIPEYSESLMDTKLTFELPVNFLENTSLPDAILFFEGTNLDQVTLENLAIVSSAQSRFRKDSLIPTLMADELYRLWIRKAINEPDSHEIIAKTVEGSIAGMFSLSLTPELIKIELVAVDPKYQKKGIAGDLMQACFNYSKKGGFKVVQVTTQLENSAACQLYRKFGFKIVETKYIYHLHVE
jgi:ribosomal protein S18 acetylase RimI-like enzyme